LGQSTPIAITCSPNCTEIGISPSAWPRTAALCSFLDHTSAGRALRPAQLENSMPRYLIDAILAAIAANAFGPEISDVWDSDTEIEVLPTSLRYAMLEAFQAGQCARR
jgi:hypothetical protein